MEAREQPRGEAQPWGGAGRRSLSFLRFLGRRRPRATGQAHLERSHREGKSIPEPGGTSFLTLSSGPDLTTHRQDDPLRFPGHTGQ